jgi:lipopolysaccharide/colanic/teichoic acid biosynthesis glycosyltransferase
LSQEAEDATLSGAFTAVNDGSASNGQYIEAPNRSGNGDTSTNTYAEFCFTVASAGSYQLQGAVWAPDGGSNSFYVTVDGQPAAGYKWVMPTNNGFTLDIVNDSIWGDDRGDALPKETVKAARPILSAKRYMRWRRPVEWLVAMVLVGLLSPLFILLAVLCLIDVGRPVFFWQMRPGRYLKPIKLIKFRTMRSGLDKDGNALSDEQRTSTLGRIIRRSKLDELPQLLSIIRGDMSFIGPRPLLPRDQPEDAELRAIVRPGVTGWAQVNGGHPLEIEEKFALDIWYIQNASLWLDIKVIWRTLRTVLLGDRVDRAAINQAKVTRERLRPAAEKLHAGAQSSVVQALDQHKRGDKRPDGVWWPKPADSLDRAS